MCIADKKTLSLISDGRICFFALEAELLKALISFRVKTFCAWLSHLQRKQRNFSVLWTTETYDIIQFSTDTHLQRKQRNFSVLWTTETYDIIQFSTDTPRMFNIQEGLCCHAIPSRETFVLLEMMGVYFRCGATRLSNVSDEST